MIKQLTSKKNLNDAYERVYRNKGSAGLDGVHINELKSILQNQGKLYIEQIERETFQVSPILGVEIPKSNGKKRLLGIPTVVDRVFQQALHQVLQPVFEPDFQQHSYGFRPERNAHQAIAQSLENINSGFKDIVDIDLKTFFDEAEHQILLELIYKKEKYQLVVKPSKWKEFKEKLKYLTKKTIPASFEERIDRINLLIRGWINYFKPASIYAKLKKLEEWLRNRLRYCIWHHWKKPERKRKNLIRLGNDQDHSYAWSRTRMGGWAVAQSPILRTTITIERLKRKGYVSLIEYYKR